MNPDEVSLLIKKIHAMENDPKVKYDPDVRRSADCYAQLAEKVAFSLIQEGRRDEGREILAAIRGLSHIA